MTESEAWWKGDRKRGMEEGDLEEGSRKMRHGERATEEAWRKGAGKRGMEEGGMEDGCRKMRHSGRVTERHEGRVPGSEAWRKGAGKRGVEEGCRKAKHGRRVPESEA